MTHAEFIQEFQQVKQVFTDHVFVVKADILAEAAQAKEATYQAALELAAEIDYNLATGSGYYFNSQGEMLTTLDEVVRAVLDNNLITAGK